MVTYTDRGTNAVYAMNSYTLKLLKVNLDWNPADYKNGTPIIPAAQQPEFNDIGRTFIVYSSAVNAAMDLWAQKSETLAYTIYSPSTTSADAVVNLLTDVFERQDEAAADVNEWLDLERAGGKTRDISFHSIKANLGEKSNPPDQEGGYYSAVVMLNLLYSTRENVPMLTRGFTYP